MHKKYLKTIEDIEALRNTDTIIHYGSDEEYVLKFVNGVLCAFYKENTDHLSEYNFPLNIEIHTPYIEVEDDPLEGDIGKLGWFWNNDEDLKDVDILNSISTGDGGHFEGQTAGWFKHFRPLTISEVEKYTGYNVVKEV